MKTKKELLLTVKVTKEEMKEIKRLANKYCRGNVSNLVRWASLGYGEKESA